MRPDRELAPVRHSVPAHHLPWVRAVPARPAGPGDAGHGGVAILLRDSCAASVISQPASDCTDCRLESLWLRVKPESGPHFSIAAVYRPPRRTAAAVQADLHELEMQFQRVLIRHPGPVFVLSDLNCNLLDTSADTGRDRLMEMLNSLIIFFEPVCDAAYLLVRITFRCSYL